MWIRWFEKWIDPWSDCLWHKWWPSESTTSKRSRTDLGELPWYLSGSWNKFCELKVLNKQKAVHLVRDDALNRGYSQKDECGNADSIGQESCGSWVRRKISCNWVSGGWRRCHTCQLSQIMRESPGYYTSGLPYGSPYIQDKIIFWAYLCLSLRFSPFLAQNLNFSYS